MNQAIISQLIVCFMLFLVMVSGCHRPTETQHVDIAIEGGQILTADSLHPVIEKGLILISQSAILYIGVPEEAPAYHASRRIDASGKLITPGWINTHTHAAMTLFRGLADDLPLQSWLEDYIWPMEASMLSASTVKTGARLAILEMLSHGVTTFTDMYMFEAEVAQAAADLGIRAVVGEGVLMFPTASAPTPEDALRLSTALYHSWKDHPLIIPSVAPHSPYTLNDAQLQACDSLARLLGIPLQIHLSETRREVAESLETHGLSPVARLDRLGLLRPGTIAAHCVHLSEHDISLLHRRGVAVAHCPESNLKLGSGIAPIPALLDSGVCVAAGTDGPASNNNLDLQEDLRTGSLIQKGVHEDPSLLTARDWFRMGTIGGATALGIDQMTGSLVVGKQADLLIYDLNTAQASPMYDPFSHIIYALDHRNLQEVIIAGQPVWRDGTLLSGNQDQIILEATMIADSIKAVFR